MRASLASALFLFLAAPAGAQDAEAFVRFRLDAPDRARCTVTHCGQSVRPGDVLRVAPGIVTLTIRYHDGEGWHEERLALDAPRGVVSCYILTLRVPVRTWEA